ncbi:hypothetical protein HMPREF9622_00044 [Cutibacterium modestum HL037PA3]|uniref:Uncharacterized protein n=1 Tax=Cutibacterium modestum HL044PA1 TaxID=765109 RepID=A0ABN0C923_9ACTN|nr:hypothetical protein HMPREF9607_00238 [Cutibacterium modestum HL044PA1]EFT16889.1 hypothetical protein HMPREF9622_00044 [Cutibacterium modestum HL037PA3]
MLRRSPARRHDRVPFSSVFVVVEVWQIGVCGDVSVACRGVDDDDLVGIRAEMLQR